MRINIRLSTVVTPKQESRSWAWKGPFWAANAMFRFSYEMVGTWCYMLLLKSCTDLISREASVWVALCRVLGSKLARGM